MPWGLVAGAVVGAVGSAYAADKQGDAAENAANAQSASAAAGIAEQRRQFDAVQKILLPYQQAGEKGLQGQLDLTGLGAPGSQQAAIGALQKGPLFTSLLAQGENSILQNASATGGLRGGNTQAALAQFSPQLLNQVINDQYGRLGGLTSIGQNAAAGVGNAGMATGNNVSNLLQQQGAAQAGNALAQGRAQSGIANGITSGVGAFAGMGGFGSFGSRPWSGLQAGFSLTDIGSSGFGNGLAYGNQDLGGYF